jgi:hypothetical protein
MAHWVRPLRLFAALGQQVQKDLEHERRFSEEPADLRVTRNGSVKRFGPLCEKEDNVPTPNAKSTIVPSGGAPAAQAEAVA